MGGSEAEEDDAGTERRLEGAKAICQHLKSKGISASRKRLDRFRQELALPVRTLPYKGDARGARLVTTVAELDRWIAALGKAGVA